MLQLEQAVQLAVKEAERLQVTLGEKESSHNQTTADLKQQLRHWAQELGAECQHLHLLLEQSGAKQNSGQLPTRYNVLFWLTSISTQKWSVCEYPGVSVYGFVPMCCAAPQWLRHLLT